MCFCVLDQHQLGTDKGKEICAKMREYATLLAVNLRKESLEQQETVQLQRKLDDMEGKLRRLEAQEVRHPLRLSRLSPKSSFTRMARLYLRGHSNR